MPSKSIHIYYILYVDICVRSIVLVPDYGNISLFFKINVLTPMRNLFHFFTES